MSTRLVAVASMHVGEDGILMTYDRLDRLVLLLDTGATPSIREAAAKQIGDVQRLHTEGRLICWNGYVDNIAIRLDDRALTAFPGLCTPSKQVMGHPRRCQPGD